MSSRPRRSAGRADVAAKGDVELTIEDNDGDDDSQKAGDHRAGKGSHGPVPLFAPVFVGLVDCLELVAVDAGDLATTDRTRWA